MLYKYVPGIQLFHLISSTYSIYLRNSGIIICIQNKIYTKSIVPGTKSTTVNLNHCKLIVVVFLRLLATHEWGGFVLESTQVTSCSFEFPENSTIWLFFFKFHSFLNTFAIPHSYIWDQKHEYQHIFWGLTIYDKTTPIYQTWAHPVYFASVRWYLTRGRSFSNSRLSVENRCHKKAEIIL